MGSLTLLFSFFLRGKRWVRDVDETLKQFVGSGRGFPVLDFSFLFFLYCLKYEIGIGMTARNL